MLLLVLGLFMFYDWAKADNPRTYEVYVTEYGHICYVNANAIDCECPCDTECGPLTVRRNEPTPSAVPNVTPDDVPLPPSNPPGNPPTATPDGPNNPMPTNLPDKPDKPTATATSIPTSVPPTATSRPTATATDEPTKVPPTATARPRPSATVAPTDTPVPVWPGGCVCHKNEAASGKVTWVSHCFKPHQKNAYDSHIAHDDDKGMCKVGK